LPSLHDWYVNENPHPGRMAPNTAFAVLLGGIILTLRRTAGSAMVRKTLAAIVITIGALGMVSYALLLDLAYSWFGFPRMSFPAGIGIVLFGAMLMFEPVKQSQLMTGAPQIKAPGDAPGIYIFIGVAMTILMAIVVVSYGSIRALMERSNSVEHTYTVRAEFDEMAAFYHQARNAVHLADFNAAAQRGWDEFALVKALTVDNPSQQERLKGIQDLMKQALSTRLHSFPALQGKPVADQIETALEVSMQQFKSEELRLLQQRQFESRASAANTMRVIVVGNLLGFTLMLVAFWQMRRQNRQRTRLEIALQQANLELESKVLLRTQELATLNATLEQHIALRTGELEDLYNNSPCGYHSVDKNGVLIRINDTELGWLGYRRDEVIGILTHRDIHTPASLRNYLTAFNIYLKTGILQDQELECVRKDGTTLMVSLNATAVRDQDGEFVMSRTTMNDITARKQAEQEIQLLNSNLQLQAENLIATNGELESFSYSVSHDLRAPLRAMNGYALMLEEDYADRLDESGMRYLSVIRTNSERMGRLIDDLLAFSRLGRQAFTKADLDMQALVQEVVTEVLQEHLSQPPAIHIALLPDARADRSLLRQVWLNLISNAAKFSKKRPDAAIWISASRDGNEITYCVKDNGVGFNMAFYGKLFGVFQRLHHASEFAGTGVGLAIVQRIVLRHNGRIWAESKDGEGATFYFTLPIEET
ncbi:MAG: ATP-binding protein, partial [Pseudomonadota bacterium]